MDRIINIWYYNYMDQDMFVIRDNDLTHGRGYVYSLQYHLVWCSKYRRCVLTDGIDEECKTILLEIAEEYKFTILAMEVMPDHIHLLVDAKPQMSIMDMMRILKGTTARKLFMLHPDLKDKLWRGHLWNPSYCAVTVSDRSREQVTSYIESQKEKQWGGPGRPPRDLERLKEYHRRGLEHHADHGQLQSGDPATAYPAEEDA